MKSSFCKTAVLKTGAAIFSLFAACGSALADSNITLTASPQSTVLPDGRSVPMWGYTCGAVSGAGASCSTLSGAAQTGGTTWQPPLITVPAGSPLKITLFNSLSFTNGNKAPTSIIIDGQLGGGLGKDRATMPSPVHGPQGTTWPGTLGGIDPSTTSVSVVDGGAGYVVPPSVTITSNGGNGSGANAIATIANGVVTGVTVTSPGSGYTAGDNLAVTIDPPNCQVNGTTCKAATATISAATLASSDGSATFVPPAQVDRVRSLATEVSAGGSADLTWANLRPGTYLLHSGTQTSIQHTMGLYAVLVVTDKAGPTTAYGTTFDKDVPLLFSEIDPDFNNAVNTAINTAGFTDTAAWNGQAGQCGDPAVHTCYPPVVNYSPQYYLVNGSSFDRTNLAGSSLTVLPTGAASTTGKLLLRMVNAGLRMHIPNVVGMTMTLLAEDGNKLPGAVRKQNSAMLVAGKTYDVTISPLTASGAYVDATLPVFDRQLSLSTSNQRDGGMQAYLKIGAGSASGAGTGTSAVTLSASDKTYYCSVGVPVTIAETRLGLLAGTSGAQGLALGATLTGDVTSSTLTLQSNGTFTYTPSSAATAANKCGGTFTFVLNGQATATQTATIAQCDANSHVGCTLAQAPSAGNVTFVSSVMARYASTPPGVLGSNITNVGGLALTATAPTGGLAAVGGTVTLNADGSFVAVPSGSPAACPPGVVNGAKCMTFGFAAKNTQNSTSNTATATVVFNPASNLQVAVKDSKTGLPIKDYRWIIEEDRTFWIDPKCQVNSKTQPPGCNSNQGPWNGTPVESLGYSFHTANMPVVAQGCMGKASCENQQMVTDNDPTSATYGQHVYGACDVGNGICRAGPTQKTPVDPASVYLDPNKRYFISVLPGDAANAVIGGAGGPDANGKPFDIATACGPYAVDGNGTGTGAWEPAGSAAMCGHEMGGAQIAAGQTSVAIGLQQTPLPTAKISVLVYQDDNPLNGENDAGGGVDIIAPNEAGLGGFEIKVFDQAGGLGDNTGQITYDQFNQPVSNALAGTIDPVTKLDACPITARKDGQVGMIPTCPTYESDGKTRSPLAGQAVVANLYPGLYEIQAYPAADRIGRGEEWLQTNTLDGGKPHEAFIRPNEPGYFQEFGPGGFHVSIGYANPKIINDRLAAYCASAANGGGTGAQTCDKSLTVHVTNNHMSRTPDARTYNSETYDHYAWTNCYVSIGPADGADFAFQKCDPNGNAVFNNIPNGTYKISVFDQWNDIMLDGLVGTVAVAGNTEKTFPVTQWRTNLYTRTYFDANGDGVSQDGEAGLALVNTNIRYRDGSIGFFNNTDLNGFAAFNEVFPFMNWLVVETSTTRYKSTGVHTVYDAGGPVDCSTQSAAAGMPCSTIAANLANTAVRVPLPVDLRLPGARYCDDADCNTKADGGASTGMISPPQPFGTSIGWQGLLGQNTFMEFGVKPYNPGENGGISGQVIYASTRPFDDPSLLLQLSWEPGVPRVKVNLYSKSVDASGNEQLHLVDTTLSDSFDDYAQGFRKDANGNLIASTGPNGGYVPNMNCPGQDATSPFFATLQNSKQYLDTPDANGNKKSLAYQSQFKCYDGWSQLNQTQPAPYDGHYQFPSVNTVGADGKPASSSCHMYTDAEPWGCKLNKSADATDWNYNVPMLVPGKYVVEVVVPAGYELVKEEDKNILLGDVFVAPVTQQFAGFGNVFIMPDQAQVNSAYNRNNPGSLNLTNALGSVTYPRHEGDTGSIEAYWPCVGAERIVPDLNSLFPQAGQAAPFAGAKRRLCDRKEVEVQDQASSLAKFYVFSSTHIAGHFTGTITNDFASEFDPFSPQFGEKFGPPNLPVGMRDFNGNEVARVYSDQWGIYNGLYFSSWTVNPPNPTGYAPQMAIACMNDPGPIPDPKNPGQMITDPAYNPAYSNFCYEMPYMPGFTAYMDTPVIPTQAFADNYNLPDSEYPDGTPVVKTVDHNGQGPWVASTGGTVASVTVTAGGSGYTSAPTVSFNNSGTGGTGAAATAVIGGPVTALSINQRGSGYVAPVTVSITPVSGGPGGGATATATLSYPVASVQMTNVGAGYTSRPSASFSGGGGSGVAASNQNSTGTFMSVGAVAMTNNGNNYTTVPTVTVSAPGGVNGTNATVTASLRVNSLTVGSRGTGYTSLPSLTFGGAGSGAAGAVNDLRLVAFTITSGGSGYTSTPSVQIAPPPCTINGNTCVQAVAGSVTRQGGVITAIAVNTAGAGYTSAPAVTITGGGGSGAVVKASMGVNSLALTANGSGYTGVASVSISGGGGTGATATAAMGVVVSLVNSGAGYTARATISFSGGGGTNAAANTTMNVTSVVLSNGGSGYTTAPSVSLTAAPGGGITATANALLDTAGRIETLTLTNGGDFYSQAPTVNFTGAGNTGSGATANITVSRRVVAVNMTNGGSGYNSAPTISFSGGGGSGAAATAVVSQPGSITITALGDKVVQNPNFTGPNATAAPYNQKTITRHYGFGSTAGTVALIGADNVAYPLTGVTWSDSQITGNVPGGLPNCPLQQQGQSGAKCGQLVIVNGDNNKQSIDAITVTVGGSAPWIVTPTSVAAPAGKSFADTGANFGRMGFSPIQAAIDNATPGDLIIVSPGTYKENLIFWKPVRLQGMGAASVTLNADAHPAGKMDQWRRQINCVFGLDLNGVPNLNDANYDPAGGGYTCPSFMHQRVDRIPFEAIVGWDASGNGNLAQVLQEPTLMGSYEGAGITVLGRGVRAPACNDPNFGANCHDFWGTNATGGAGAFTDGSVYLQSNNNDCKAVPAAVDGTDYGTSNYYCNPSRIDGISVINSSQGGGAIFVHGWAQNLEIANTHVFGNQGTLAGAINLGNGETPDAFINDGVECGVNLTGANAITPCPPIPNNTATNAAIPFQHNTNVRIHNNMLYNNASIGDALFSGTPAGAGAITVSAGADNYRIDHNWIAANLSTGDGGGIQHLGLSFNGRIDHNYVLFNQSTNPTLPTNGGGIVVEGANLDRQLNGNECGSFTDQDCPPGLAEGVGSGTVIDANLILGNSAESGSGGGLRLQQINGSADLIAFPNGNNNTNQWYGVTVTNNIIANNVAGYDGGGVSMQDALKVSLVNNTIASNDTTASAGALFKTLGAIMSNTPPPGCTPQTDPTLPQDPSCLTADAPHGPQPAGLVVQAHTVNLIQALIGANLNCSGLGSGPGYTTTGGINDCLQLSKPTMVNNMFWGNRAFSPNIVDQNGNVVSGNTNPTGQGLQSQQNLIALTPALVQKATGDCAPGANYWDIGLRTDDVNSGLIPPSTRLKLQTSIYTGDTKTGIVIGGSTGNLTSANSPMIAAFCNGARMPPEHCLDGGVDNGSPSCKGYNAPVGASETTGLTQVFVFNGIQPTATVDEGHNWLNLSYGPLTMARPNVDSSKVPTPAEAMLVPGTSGLGTTVGAYSIPRGSVAVAAGAVGANLPSQVGSDFFGNARTVNNSTKLDIGAVALTTTATAVRPTALAFGQVPVGSTSTLTVTLAVGGAMTVNSIVVTPTNGTPATDFTTSTNCVGPRSGNSSCTITVTYAPSVAGAGTATLAVSGTSPVLGSPVALTGAGMVDDLYATSTTVLFGNVSINSNATQSVTLKNATASTITGISTSINGGNNGNGFSIVSGGSCTTSLAANSTCTVNVQFAPTVLGSASATLTLGAASGVKVGSSVTLSGNGTNPAPVLNAINPASMVQGATNQTLTLTGQYFTNANTVAVGGTGVTVNTFYVQDDNTIVATVSVAGNASTGNHAVTVTTDTGISNQVVNLNIVKPPVPKITAVTPNSGSRNNNGQPNTIAVTLTGQNLTGASAVAVSGNGDTETQVTVVNDTTVTFLLTLQTNASTGNRTVTVTTPGGTSNGLTFTITQ